YRFLGCRVKLPGHQARNQTAKCRPHLVGTGGEPFANQYDDTGRNTRKAGRKLHVIDSAETATLWYRLVFPGDPEQVAWIEVPETNAAQFFFDFTGDQLWVFHLREGGNDDAALANPLDGALTAFRIDCEIDFHFVPGSCF